MAYDEDITARARQLAKVTDWTVEELLEASDSEYVFNIDDYEIYQVLTKEELADYGYKDIYASNIHQHSDYWVVTLK